MNTEDLLRDLLRVASNERTLTDAHVEPFAAALRERAALVLAQRVASLEAELASSHEEAAHARETHDRLLAHHREALSRLATDLSRAAALPFYHLRRLRRQLRALADSLRRGIP